MNDTTQIAALVQPYLNDGQFYIVDIQVAGRQGGTLKVTVLVDSDAGITIEECARIGRQLGNQMDEQNFFGDAPFNLEVSSPGVDFPLTQPRQFAKNVGRMLKVQQVNGATLTGKLDSVTDEGLVLDVPMAKISKTKRKTMTDLPPEGLVPVRLDEIQKATVEVIF